MSKTDELHHLMTVGAYDEAILAVEELDDEIETMKTVMCEAIHHAINGEPYEALTLLVDCTHPYADAISLAIRETLPTYATIFQEYNEILTLAKQTGGNRQVSYRLSMLLSRGHELPLPIQMYETYLYMNAATWNRVLCEAAIRNFPLPVQSHSRIVSFLMQYEMEHTVKNQRTLIQRMVAALVVIVVCLGAIAFGFSHSQAKVDAMNETITELQANLREKNKVLSSIEKNEVQTPDVILHPSVQEAVKHYYQGFVAFGKKDYALALHHLERAQTRDVTYYFSDDALYYAMRSAKELKNDTLFVRYYTSFLAQTSQDYQASPYRDDVMLAGAKHLISKGERAAAEAMLVEITRSYPTEWTATVANQLQNDLLSAIIDVKTS
ncbi:MAG: tetratricopeptide repeat protein [Bacilli bacterium]